jgi:hypothetical protein
MTLICAGFSKVLFTAKDAKGATDERFTSPDVHHAFNGIAKWLARGELETAKMNKPHHG